MIIGIINEMNQSKSVLITGCSSGFGYLLALLYSRKGYTTYASVRNTKSDGALKLTEIAEKEKLPLHLLHIDVCDDALIKKAVESIQGPIDILINNAGFGIVGPVEEFSVAEIKEQYETNVFGMIRMIKAVAPKMRKQGNGMIINISSINGLIPFPLWGVYCSSKFAVEALTEALRFELAHFGIRVVLVEPGSFLTNFTENRKFTQTTESATTVYKDLTRGFFDRFNRANNRIKKGVVRKLFSPEKVANKIYKLSQQKNPSFRNRVGIDAHVYYATRQILPYVLWEKLMRFFYRW